MELNSGLIIELPNVHTKVSLEPAGDKKTQSPSKQGIQIEEIRS